MADKVEIKELIHTFSPYDFEGKMEDVAKLFDFKNWFNNTYKKQYPHIQFNINKFHRFVIDHNTYYDYGSDDATHEFKVSGFRWETDEKFNKRIETNKKKSIAAKKAAITKEEAKKKRELTLYENLKKKYGTKENNN